jgi:hypothetical protein
MLQILTDSTTDHFQSDQTLHQSEPAAIPACLFEPLDLKQIPLNVKWLPPLTKKQ